MKYQNLGANIRKNIGKYQQKNAVYYKDRSEWHGISWKDFGNQIEQISLALIQTEVEAQQNVAIYSQNSSDWITTDLAIMSIRAVTVPLYATNSAKEVEYIVNDAEINVLFVGEQEQYDEAVKLLKDNKFLKLIVAFKDDIEFSNKKNSVYLKDFISLEPNEKIKIELQKRYQESTLSDLACIIYTSGTTGEPKGVMLDHANFVETIRAHEIELEFSDKESSLSFLPLSHVFEHNWVLLCLHNGIEVYFNESPKFIANALKEVKPNYMCAVPRFYEKIHGAIQENINTASAIKNELMKWAVSVG
ncbi:MAG: long-chain fatty acid--CoA ligase, partial [Bacteroidetes bacterium]